MENFTIKSLLDGYAEGKFSAREVTSDYLARIKQDKHNAYVCETPDLALEQAEKADKLMAEGDFSGLMGVPMGLKDNLSTKGIETTAGSKILKGYKPPFNAPVVDRLYNAGAICLGKTNTDEFTCGASSETSCFGVTLNPYDDSKVSGGSSGGSAAAISANLGVFTMGTDTGGSIRQPASFCNAVGLKVTYGRVPRSGVISMASSLDTIGHFTKTVEDSALVLNITAGADRMDQTTPDVDVRSYTDYIGKGVKGLKIGLPSEYFAEGINEEVKAKVMEAVSVLEGLGAEIVEISLPYTKYGVAVYYIVSPSEVSANMARYDGIRFGHKMDKEADDLMDQYLRYRGEGFGDEMKRRIMVGTYALSSGYYDAYYLKAQKVRSLLIQDFERAFKEVDVIVSPVAPTTAFGVGEMIDDPVAMYMADLLTIPASCAGIPGISVPCGFDKAGLPVGLQILAPQFEEGLLFQVGDAYEKETEFWREV